MGKPSSGLLAGARVIWLGSYSKCTRMIEGSHYCLVITELQGSPPVPKPVMHFLVSSIAIFFKPNASRIMSECVQARSLLRQAITLI